MRTGRKITLSIALLIVGGFAWCQLAYPTYTYHYRMTVEVEANGKLYSSSSVIEVRLVKQVQIATQVPRVATEVSGEAVFVDLGGGHNVIAVLASGPTAMNVDYPKYLVPRHFKLSYDDEDLVKFPKLQGSWELSAEQLPAFVTFTDLNDPTTARVVPSAEFGRVFDSSVHLRNVTIEMTSGAVTREIKKKLPWLPHPEYLSGQFACGPKDAHCLDGGSFSRS